jgi:hypothetical protein
LSNFEVEVEVEVKVKVKIKVKMIKAIVFSFWMMLNPGHVSMTSIEHVTGTDSLMVTCRMTFDDFIRDMRTIDDDRNLDRLFNNGPYPTDLINQYFNLKVFISINNKLLIGKLLNATRIDKDINLRLYYKTDKKPKKITVRNMILKGWYSDQTNLTIIRINNFEKGIKLTPEYYEETFSLK